MQEKDIEEVNGIPSIFDIVRSFKHTTLVDDIYNEQKRLREFVTVDGIKSKTIEVGGQTYTNAQFEYFLMFLNSGYYLYPHAMKQEVRDEDEVHTGEYVDVKGFVACDHMQMVSSKEVPGTVHLSTNYKELYNNICYTMPRSFLMIWRSVLTPTLIEVIGKAIRFEMGKLGTSEALRLYAKMLVEANKFKVKLVHADMLKQNIAILINAALTEFTNRYVCQNCGNIVVNLKTVVSTDENDKDTKLNICRDCTSRLFKNQNTKPQKIGRNAPCPCGSGGKYKHCCGAN